MLPSSIRQDRHIEEYAFPDLRSLRVANSHIPRWAKRAAVRVSATLVLGFWFYPQKPPYADFDSNGIMKRMPKVTIYSTPTCPYCLKSKEFFKKNNVEYEEIDVSRNEAALQDMVERSGQMGVPVIEIDGRVVVGFDRPKLSEFLGMKQLAKRVRKRAG